MAHHLSLLFTQTRILYRIGYPNLHDTQSKHHDHSKTTTPAPFRHLQSPFWDYLFFFWGVGGCKYLFIKLD